MCHGDISSGDPKFRGYTHFMYGAMYILSLCPSSIASCIDHVSCLIFVTVLISYSIVISFETDLGVISELSWTMLELLFFRTAFIV